MMRREGGKVLQREGGCSRREGEREEERERRTEGGMEGETKGESGEGIAKRRRVW